jgi:DnaJ like chaperone protein
MVQQLVTQFPAGPKGGAVRTALDRLWGLLGFFGRGTPARRTAAFSMAFIGLAAKMAKADGVAVRLEADAFERCFDVLPEHRDSIRRLYELAAQDVSGYDLYAGKIARLLRDDPETLRNVLECLFVIATADGVMHRTEDVFLRKVAGIFGMSADDYLHIRCLFVTDPDSPYETLGVAPSISDSELKARYLALVREHHPDALVARGVPREFHAAADRKLATINAAYETILKARAARVTT